VLSLWRGTMTNPVAAERKVLAEQAPEAATGPGALSEEVEERLALCRVASRKHLLHDYLVALSRADGAIQIHPGDSTWGAIEVLHSGQHIARVFPKSAKVQVDSRIPNSKPGDYGPKVELIPKGMWRITIRNEDDVAVLLRCTSDAVVHARGQRIRPPDLTATSWKRLGDTLRETRRRSKLPASLRFAVLIRDSFTCQYDGRSAPDVILHVDHRIPVSQGGDDSMDNLVTACQDCNLGKSDRFRT
jgi:HNH endonuclease